MARDGDTRAEVRREVMRLGALALTTVRPARETRAPLLFVPGLFAAAWMFERWLEYFAGNGHLACAVDLRGHGLSDAVADRGRVAMDDYVADALHAVRALGRPVAIGHSMGGLIVQKLAEADVVEAAVLVSPAPPRGIPPLSLQLIVRQAKYLPALLRSREIRVGRADAEAIIMNGVSPEQRTGLFSRMEPDSGRAARDLMLGALAVASGRVRCPLLVAAGDEDRFIPLRVARRVAAKYGAPLLVLPGRGHLMMQEPGWEEAAAAIEHWLAGLPR